MALPEATPLLRRIMKMLGVSVRASQRDRPPALPPHIQRGDLDRSKRDIEAWTGRTVHGFASPYGLYRQLA